MKALVVFLVILLIGGAVSSGLVPSAPVLVQSVDPNASVMQATPEQANQLVFWVIFVTINVLGAGLTIAGLVWLGSRAIENAKATPNAPAKKSEELSQKAS